MSVELNIVSEKDAEKWDRLVNSSLASRHDIPHLERNGLLIS